MFPPYAHHSRQDGIWTATRLGELRLGEALVVARQPGPARDDDDVVTNTPKCL